ncbi:MAG: hypothetical protein H6733_06045 [Alphaproteobacteria bacterium]|nr:hypothetical protein [Alphaproteobacteria bacterium]
MNAAPTSRRHPRHADRLLVVMSDIEMGAGGVTDDFPHDAWLAELIDAYDAGPTRHLALDLVFNGDTFDFLKTSYLDGWPRHITADVALGKLMRVAAAHPHFFAGVRRFLASTAGPRAVHFIVGNHDFELLFPAVQDALRALLGAPERVHFPGMQLDVGDVHIEHGSQGDRLFAIDPAQPFVRHQGVDILALPWGAVALLDVAMPLHPLVYHHDRLTPRGEVFRMLPELNELVVARYWAYWTRDYWRGWFSGADPTKRLSWTMFREVMYRFGSRDTGTSLDASFDRMLREPDGPSVILLGHLHEARWSSYADRKLLVTGAMRNEFVLAPDGTVARPMPKVFAEVWMQGEHAVRSELVEVDGPPVPAGYCPESLYDVRPAITALLAHVEQRDDIARAAAHQEHAERKDGPPGGPGGEGGAAVTAVDATGDA